MITPSKTISFKNSITFKMLCILDEQFDEISLAELYQKTKRKFVGLDEFVYAVDVLHILGKIDVDVELGKIRKC